MVKASKSTQTVTNTVGCGQTAIQMDMEFLPGQMEESIKAYFEMERKKVKDLLF